VVIVASGMAAALYENGVEKFTLTGNITSGIPSFKPPSFSLTHDNRTYGAGDFFEVRHQQPAPSLPDRSIGMRK